MSPSTRSESVDPSERSERERANAFISTLTSAVGLGGRDSAMPSPNEKQRPHTPTTLARIQTNTW